MDLRKSDGVFTAPPAPLPLPGLSAPPVLISLAMDDGGGCDESARVPFGGFGVLGLGPRHRLVLYNLGLPVV